VLGHESINEAQSASGEYYQQVGEVEPRLQSPALPLVESDRTVPPSASEYDLATRKLAKCYIILSISWACYTISLGMAYNLVRFMENLIWILLTALGCLMLRFVCAIKSFLKLYHFIRQEVRIRKTNSRTQSTQYLISQSGQASGSSRASMGTNRGSSVHDASSIELVPINRVHTEVDIGCVLPLQRRGSYPLGAE
jgi:hypothetical protein